MSPGAIAFGDPIDWGVAAEKLLAPPPATPASLSVSHITAGQVSVSFVVTGTSVAGSGFYDTLPTITDPCRKRIGAAVTAGVTVTSITYTDPTHVTLDVSTVGATPGTADVMITNPDGQSLTGSGILTITPPITTTTKVVSSLNPSTYGDLVTFTATVTSGSGTPTGTVAFLDGATSLGSNPLNGGVASISTSFLTAGTHTITAKYGGGGLYASSSGTVSPDQVVNKAATSIGLVSSKNPSTYGDSVTFTATVTSPSLLTPVGSVTFTVDVTPTIVALDGSGKAALTTSVLTAGTHTVAAIFTGSPNFAASSSTTLAGGQVVDKAAAGITLTGLAQTYDGNPKPIGANTTPPGLLVIFSYNSSPTPPADAGSYPVSGVISDTNYSGSASGTLVISKAAAGITLTGLAQTYDGNPKPIGANTTPPGLLVVFSYNGSPTPPTNAGSYPVSGVISDTNYSGSASGTLDVSQVSTSLALVSSKNPSTYGDSVTFTATVSSPSLLIPVGSATFTIDGSPTIVALDGSGKAALTTSLLTVGKHTVAAIFTGSPNFAASSSKSLAGGQVVDKAAAGVTLTGLAQIYNGTPRAIGATTVPLGLAVDFLYSGSATPPTIAGSYPVTGTVNDPNYVGAASGTLVISRAATNIGLASSSNPSVFGRSVTFTATVTSTFGLTPGGPVTFTVDGTPTIVALDVNGAATLTSGGLAAGSHAISASYSQSTNFSSSGPAALTQKVEITIYLPTIFRK